MSAAKRAFGAFDKKVIPAISCFNHAKTPLGVEFDTLIEVMQEYVDKHVAPVWGTPAKLIRSSGFRRRSWGMVFLDVADAPNALAYHDLTPEGLPLAKVFVKSTLENGDLVSVAASHELAEMLVDPAINLLATGTDLNVAYAYECADPVEELSFKVSGVPVSDFVYPSYFEAFRKPGSVQFDHLDKVRGAFKVLSGGYQMILDGGKWSNIYGTPAKKRRFQSEDRRGHRSEQRKKKTHLRSVTSKL